ncbi:MAG: hypothetical protein FJ261_06280 [Planctomycetes bacterium]|nr:hypothetical protein [Planctomycetota bacterium]
MAKVSWDEHQRIRGLSFPFLNLKVSGNATRVIPREDLAIKDAFWRPIKIRADGMVNKWSHENHSDFAGHGIQSLIFDKLER